VWAKPTGSLTSRAKNDSNKAQAAGNEAEADAEATPLF